MNNIESLLEAYQKLNQSYKKRLVFHLGCEAGFFSEYNNMILAILYCLENQIQFVLYSRDANFGFERGWTDFFLPFCKESSNSFHKKYNKRSYQINFDILSSKLKFYIQSYKKLNNILLTQDVWQDIRDYSKDLNKSFYIPELGIDGNIRHACSVLVKMTWNYNKKTGDAINTLKVKLHLPEKYVGLHIRQGDKFVENDVLNPILYIEKSKQLSANRNVFILTDDYRVITLLKESYPDWNIFTLCSEDENGYVFSGFLSLNEEEQKVKFYKLFASVDIISLSDFFIGTFSANPGMYLGMRMPVNKTFGLDFENWLIW